MHDASHSNTIAITGEYDLANAVELLWRRRLLHGPALLSNDLLIHTVAVGKLKVWGNVSLKTRQPHNTRFCMSWSRSLRASWTALYRSLFSAQNCSRLPFLRVTAAVNTRYLAFQCYKP
jgi:hypothetical protein